MSNRQGNYALKIFNNNDGEKVFARIEQLDSKPPVVRYQFDNHLGSASLELDTAAAIISYEEYHPFGSTSYRSGKTETEVSLKRYKYNGKERNDETGLYYYGARYYAAWLGRFVSVDPLSHQTPSWNPYHYCHGNPVNLVDPTGMRATGPDDPPAGGEPIAGNTGGIPFKQPNMMMSKFSGDTFGSKSNSDSGTNSNSTTGNFSVSGPLAESFVSLLSERSGLNLELIDGFLHINDGQNQDTSFSSNVLAELVKSIINGETDKVSVIGVSADEDIAFDQFPFQGGDSTSYYSQAKDNYVDMSDMLNIGDAPELQAAFFGVMLTERANASEGFESAHMMGLQTEGDIIREVYPDATNRIQGDESLFLGENIRPLSDNASETSALGGLFNFTSKAWIVIINYSAQTINDIKRANKVKGVVNYE